MKFYILILIIAFVLLFIAILFDVNYIRYKSPVPYSKWQEISFYDFKGLKKPGMSLFGINEFAYIKTNREITYLNDRTFKIVTYFYPSRSYVFAQNIRNAGLLKHELYHFHISEYCTRLFRKEIISTKAGIPRSKLTDLNKKYYELEDELQTRYDEDSYHSYVFQEQKKWELKMDSMLQSLQTFSDPVIHLQNRE
jgi:hypothetical protein